jgi:hypothetical protein
MKKIEINSIIEANEWFIAASEEEVMELLVSQPVLSALVQEMIEEDLEDEEEYAKDMFYSIYGTILKAYKENYNDYFKEVKEEDIDVALNKQNRLSELIEKALGISSNSTEEEKEKNTANLMEKFNELESKFKENKDFDLENAGFEGLAELLKETYEELSQPSIYAFLQAELEDADFDEETSGLINHLFMLILEVLEAMLERNNGGKAVMKVV